MQKKNKKVFKAKYSNFNTQKKVRKEENPMIKALQKIAIMGGTVTYFYTKEERVWNTLESKWEDKVTVKARLHSDINPQVFYKLVDGRTVRRTYEEVIQMFHEIAQDYGASSFELG